MPADLPATSPPSRTTRPPGTPSSIFASHEYGCGTLPSEPSIAAAGKEYWETEVDTGAGSGDSTGDGIASALPMATTIHNDLTKANLNAWHTGGSIMPAERRLPLRHDHEGMDQALWVLGNYARFVRPGYMRVSTSGTAPSGVLVSAYRTRRMGPWSWWPSTATPLRRTSRFMSPATRRVRSRPMRRLRARAWARALSSASRIARDGDPLRTERDDLRRNAVEVAKGAGAGTFIRRTPRKTRSRRTSSPPGTASNSSA